ncbi:hypothetical protein [Buchananella felis]|uniref:hypothetical protein n=1 Tax=Buchananella felis TaxID=3231492 RepID=UPI0035292C3B
MNRLNWQRYQIAIIAWFEAQPIELQAAFPMNRWRSLFRLGSKGREIPFFDAEEMLHSMLDGDQSLRTSLVEPLCAHLNAAFGHNPPAVPAQGASPQGGGAGQGVGGGEGAAGAGDAGGPVDEGTDDAAGVVFPGYAPGGGAAFGPNPLAMLSPYDMPWVDDAPAEVGGADAPAEAEQHAGTQEPTAVPSGPVVPVEAGEPGEPGQRDEAVVPVEAGEPGEPGQPGEAVEPAGQVAAPHSEIAQATEAEYPAAEPAEPFVAVAGEAVEVDAVAAVGGADAPVETVEPTVTEPVEPEPVEPTVAEPTEPAEAEPVEPAEPRSVEPRVASETQAAPDPAAHPAPVALAGPRLPLEDTVEMELDSGGNLVAAGASTAQVSPERGTAPAAAGSDNPAAAGPETAAAAGPDAPATAAHPAPAAPRLDPTQEAAIAAATGQDAAGAALRAATPAPAPGRGEDGQEWNFPEYDFSRPDLEPLVSVRSERTREGLRYTWRDAGDGEVYRVVVETGGFSTDVELGRTVCWTKRSHAIDPQPADSPCRFITVWGYEDLGDGELGQCRRVAAGVNIAQVENLRVEVAGPSVRAQWEVPGAPVGSQTDTEVVVARLPGDANVGMEIQTESWLNHTLASNMYNCLDGIDDSTGTPGQRYVYLAAVKVRVGNRFEMGRPVVFRADLQQAPLAKPQHFSVNADVSAGGNVCTLTWQAVPGTRVRVFRTTRSPHSAAAEQPTVGVEQLVDAGLRPEDELHGTPTPCPGQEGRGLVQLTGVEWPDGAEYDRLYFTPVATRDGLASVGRTQVLVRSGEIADVRLVQRLDWQLLTFAWPGEAASVQLRRTGGNGPVPVEGAQCAPADLTCTRQEYSRQGGFVISGGGDTWGSQVQLNAVSYYDGQPIYGRPALVDLDPLYRFEYSIEWPSAARAVFKLLGKSKNLVRVTVRAAAGTPCPPELLPHLMLVHNPQYLPLHWRDGTPVAVSPSPDGREQAPQVTAFPAPGGEVDVYFPADDLQGGYVRLMVCAEPEAVHGRANTAAWAYAAERYALTDPDAESLQVER